MRRRRLLIAALVVVVIALLGYGVVRETPKEWAVELFSGAVTPPDEIEYGVAISVLRAVSSGTRHGLRDDGKPLTELAAGLAGGLELTCGYVSQLAQAMLAEYGIEARLVDMLTALEFDGNNGHTALEVRIGDVWYFADVDFGRLYQQSADSLRRGRGAWVQIGEWIGDPEDAAIYPRHIDNGVMGIRAGDRIYYDCEDLDGALVAHVEGYDGRHECLSHDEWLKRFYGGAS